MRLILGMLLALISTPVLAGTGVTTIPECDRFHMVGDLNCEPNVVYYREGKYKYVLTRLFHVSYGYYKVSYGIPEEGDRLPIINRKATIDCWKKTTSYYPTELTHAVVHANKLPKDMRALFKKVCADIP